MFASVLIAAPHREAEAQSTPTVVWETTMTVGESFGSVGYEPGLSGYGSIDPSADFTHKGVTFFLSRLRFTDSLSPNAQFGKQGPGADPTWAADYRLCLDGTSVVSYTGSSGFTVTNGTDFTLSPRWTSGQKVEVKLVEGTACPPPPVLVSNLGQTSSKATREVIRTSSWGQAFTTGTNAAGYSLDSIDVDIVAGSATSTTGPHVRLQEASGANPGRLLATMTNPALSGTSSGVHTFTAPEGTTLAANTTYFVVFACDGSLPLFRRCLHITSTNSTGEDSGGAVGFSIGNNNARNGRHVSNWRAAGNLTLRFRLNGEAVTAPTLAQVEGVSVAGAVEGVDVSWDAVTGADGYVVQWKSGTETFGTARQATVSSGTTHTIGGLTQGTEYTVRVAATKSGASDGEWSAEATGIPIWTAVMEVGTWFADDASLFYGGFDPSVADLDGLLAPKTLAYKGATFEIAAIRHEQNLVAGTTGGRFKLTAQGAQTDSLVLCLGGTSMGAKTWLRGDASGVTEFTDSLSWEADDKRDVALVASGENCPTAMVTTALAGPDSISSASPISVTVTLGASASGLAADDFVVTGGTRGALTGAGTSYSLAVTPTGSEDVTVALPLGAARTSAGAYTASHVLTVPYEAAVDTTKPTVAITVDDASLTGSERAVVTVTFSEPVDGFADGDLSASPGTLTRLTGTSGTFGAVHTFRLTPPATGMGTINLNVAAGVAADAADNTNSAATQVQVAYDNAHVVSVTPATVTVAENGGTATVNVKLTGQPASEVRVTAGSSDSDAVTAAPDPSNPVLQQLVFDSSNWNIAQTVTITGVNDNIVNPGGSRTAQIEFNAASVDNAFNQLTGRYRVTVTVNDHPGLEAVTLVSNLGQTAHGGVSTSGSQNAQAFTTGTNASGYVLAGIEASLEAVAAPDAVTVKVHNASGGNPGTVLAALSNPELTTATTGTVTFAAPEGTELAAGRTYFVVFSCAAGHSGVCFTPVRTLSAAEDSGKAAGFSIADDRRRGSPSLWTPNTNNAFQIAVTGAAKAVTNTAPVFTEGATATRSLSEDTGSTKGSVATVGDPVAATDADEGDTLTYSVSGGTDMAAFNDSFTLNTSTGQISRKAVLLSHEDKNSWAVTLQVADAAGATDTIDVTISLNDVTETPLVPTALSVTAKAGTTDTLSVSWTAPANTGRPPISTYTLAWKVSTAADSTFSAEGVTRTGTTAEISGLTAGTSHTVWVRARNAEGNGGAATATGSTAASVTNTAATGEPKIIGGALEGITLHASAGTIADANGLTNPSYTYQWIRVPSDSSADVNIGTNSAMYTVVAADVGHKIKVRLSFTDDGSFSESRTSAATAVVRDQGTVQVSNISQVGSDKHGTAEFRAQAFTTGANHAGYDLRSVDVNIGSVTNPDLVVLKLVSDGNGQPGTDVLTFTNPALSTATTGVQTFAAPAGTTLTANTTYFVEASCNTSSIISCFELVRTRFGGEDSGGQPGWSIADNHQVYNGFWWSPYDNLDALGGSILKIRVRAAAINTAPVFTEGETATRRLDEDTGGPAGSARPVGTAVAATDVDNESLTYSVTTTGPAKTAFDAAFTLNTSTGQISTKSGAVLNFESDTKTWTVSLGVADTRGGSDSISVTISLNDVVEVPLAPTSLSVTAPTRTSDTLSVSWTAPANTGRPDISSYEVAWKLPSAADSTYSTTGVTRTGLTARISGLTAATAYTVRVRAVNDEGDGAPATANGSTRAVNSPATGKPTLTGSVQAGRTLTVDATGIMDANGRDGATFSYRWFRVDKDGGADTSVGGNFTTYTTVAADVGHKIKVIVSFSDDDGYGESVASDDTGIITADPVLVSNTGRGAFSGSFPVSRDIKVSQQFSTGSNRTGYEIVGVELPANAVVAPSEVTVKIHSVGTGNAPGTEQFALTHPALTRQSAGRLIFLAPDDSELAAGTDYLLVVSCATTGSDTCISVQYTSATAQDLGGSAGWSIADNSFWTISSPSTWEESTNGVIRMRVTGTAKELPPNNLATGTPTIVGLASVGTELSVDITGIEDDDGLTNVSYSYQWIRVGTGSTTTNVGTDSDKYTPVAADVGSKLKVRVSFTDDLGHAESRETAETSAVAAAGPSLLVSNLGQADANRRPGLTLGQAQAFTTGPNAGGYLLADISWDLHSVSNRSALTMRVRADSGGEPGAVLYTMTTSSSGELIFTAPAGSRLRASSTYYADVSCTSGTCAILQGTGSASQDSGSAMGWSIADSTWRRQSDSSWRRQDAGSGDIMKIRVRGTTRQAAANTAATGTPTITGTAQTGQTLTAAPGTIADANGLDAGVIYSYQWIRVPSAGSESPINGATSQTYTPVTADVGSTLKVRLSFEDDDGHDESRTSAETAVVTETVTAAGSITNFGTANGRDLIDLSWNTVSDATGYLVQWRSGSQDWSSSMRQATVAAPATSYRLTGLTQGTRYEMRVRATKTGAPDGNWSSTLTRTPYFTAVLIVGSDVLGNGVTVIGFGENAGSLTPNTMLWESTSYEITRVRYRTDTRAGQFKLSEQGSVNDPFRLCLDGKRPALGYQLLFGSSSGFTSVAIHSMVTWTVGAKADVAIVTAAEQCPTSGVTAALAGPTMVESLSAFNVTLTLGGAVTGLTADDFAVTGGTAGTLTAGAGNTYTLAVTPDGSAEVLVALPLAAARSATGANTASAIHTVAYTPPNRAPVFTDGATATRSIAEDTGGTAGSEATVGTPVAATDADMDTLTYSVTGGADQTAFDNSFTLNASTGQISRKAVLLSHEATKNSWAVTLQVADPDGLTDTINVTVSLIDVNEPPVAPTGLSVSAKASTTDTLSVSWTAPVNTGRPNISSYAVEWKLTSAADSTYSTTGVTITGTTAEIGGLTAGTSHTVRVRAVNDEGNGAPATASGSTGAVTNTAATGTPTISGTAQVGQVLTAAEGTIEDANGLTSPTTYMYQWIRVPSDGTPDVNIGTNSAMYTVAAADEGHKIKVKLSFTDDDGFSESATSAETGVVAAALPVLVSNQGQTAASGNTGASQSQPPAQGFTTGTNVGGYSLAGVELDLATVPTPSAVVVTVHNASGDNPGTTLVTLTNPTLTSTTTGPQTFTAPDNTTLSASTTYLVQITCSSGGGSSCVTLKSTASTAQDTGGLAGWSIADAARWRQSANTWIALSSVVKIAVKGTAVDAANTAPVFTEGATAARSLSEDTGGTAGSVATVGTPVAATDADTDSLTYSVTGGTDQTAFDDSFTLNASTGQISRKAVLLSHETKDSWAVTLGVSDGRGGSASIAVTISLNDVTEVPLAPTALAVTAKAGTTDTLSVSWTAPTNTGRPNISSYDVEWKLPSADDSTYSTTGVTITGTTAAISGLTAGTTYTVRVRAVNDEGDGAPATANGSTGTAAAVNTAATGTPTISGTAQVGQVLTADKGTIADANGLTSPTTYTYQWIRVPSDSSADVDIGTNSHIYTVADADEGHKIKVRLSFTDDDGFSESATSAETGVVAAALPVLVSNLGQTADSSTLSANPAFQHAQAFTTGTNTAGYTLAGVQARLLWKDPAVVKVHNASGSNPGTELVTLTNPASFPSTTSNVMFTAPEGTVLAANTTYLVVFSCTPGSSSACLDLSYTTAGSEDPGAADGFSIANNRRRHSSGSWSGQAGEVVMIAVTGAAAVNMAPTFTEGATAARSLSEDTGGTAGAVGTVGTPVEATDADMDSLTYSVTGGSDQTAFDDSFTLNSSTGQISRKAVLLSHETKDSWAVTLGVSDGRGGSASINVTVSLNDVTEVPVAPTALSVSGKAGTSDTLSVSWTAPTNTGRPNISGYNVAWKVAGAADSTYSTTGVTITGTTAEISGLTAGTSFTVRVLAVNDEGDGAPATANGSTRAANVPATGAPVITGTAQRGRVLTAGPGTIADADGLANVSYIYQWIRVETNNSEADIAGATS